MALVHVGNLVLNGKNLLWLGVDMLEQSQNFTTENVNK